MQDAAARSRLLQLIRTLSYRRGQVTLASGRVSDFYVDGRQTTLHAEGALLCGQLIYDHIEQLRQGGLAVTGVGGMTLGADPLAVAAAVVSQQRGAPVHAFLVRKEPKGHGTGAQIEGMANLPSGSQVLLVEDTVTTGGSTLRAIDAVRQEGLAPVAVLSLVDREEGGEAALGQSGLPYTPLFRRRDIEERA